MALEDYGQVIAHLHGRVNAAFLYRNARLLRWKNDLAGAARGCRPLAALPYSPNAGPNCVEGAFWLYLIRCEAGERAAADKELGAFMDRLREPFGEVSAWQRAVGSLFLGRMREDQLAAIAGKGTRYVAVEAEFPFYAAMMHLRDGDRAGALERFRRALGARLLDDSHFLDQAEARRMVQQLESNKL